jgi:hypothetical protein
MTLKLEAIKKSHTMVLYCEVNLSKCHFRDVHEVV